MARGRGRRAVAASPRRGVVPESPATIAIAAHADRAALAAWIALVVLVAARVALGFVPAMAAWGLNVARFVPAWAGWPLTALAALSLLPPLARRALRPAARAGDFLVERGAWGLAVACAAAAAVVLALPDRAWYVGDFLLRQGAVEQQIGAARVFPQALPLDRLLHNTLPTLLAAHAGWDANATGRLLGALAAAVLAWAAVTLVRALELRGAAALAGAVVVFAGGYLAVMTGYSKAIVELCALTAAVGACALRVVRTGRGWGAYALALALAFALHRSALGLLPGAIATWAWALRRPDARAALRRPAVIAALLLPLLSLALVLPRALRTFRDVDVAVHLAPAAVRAQGGALAAAFAGLRALDLANLVAMLVPLLPVALVALLAGGVPRRGRELVLLALYALPFVAFVPLIHPAQGMFRDWDDFVAAGSALALVAAWVLGRMLDDARARAWVAVPVIACATVFALQWLAHPTDPDRGLARMRAFLDEPPRRDEAERVAVFDYLGIRSMRLDRYEPAATAFRAAADLAPNPRFMVQWGIAASRAHDDASARDAYERLIARTPRDPLGWRGLMEAGVGLGDAGVARRGAQGLLRIQPGDPDAVEVLQALRDSTAR